MHLSKLAFKIVFLLMLLPAFVLADSSGESSSSDGLKCRQGSKKHQGFFCKIKNQKFSFCTICNVCGDGVLVNADGEECDQGDDNSAGAKCNSDCQKTYCGDGIIQSPNGFDLSEECDNGADNAADAACSTECKRSSCGDGIKQSPNADGIFEECDLGRDNGENSACSVECKKTVCGDGILQRPNGDNVYEECDQEQFQPGYPAQRICKNDCSVAFCGNEIQEQQGDYVEECDYKDISAAILAIDLKAKCNDSCEALYCGDGIKQAGEQCDDGNRDDNDFCTNSCRYPQVNCAADTVKHSGYLCEDKTGDSVFCTICNKCGDGRLIEADGEECDDGNQIDNDACSNSCKKPVCGDGIKHASEQCDDGNQVNNDACTNACKTPVCGDQIVQSGELCDDGNQIDDDECTNSCQFPICGDGILHDDEQCDDGNDLNTDQCTNLCQNAVCGDGFTQGVEECDGGVNCNADCTLKCPVGVAPPSCYQPYCVRRGSCGVCLEYACQPCPTIRFNPNVLYHELYTMRGPYGNATGLRFYTLYCAAKNSCGGCSRLGKRFRGRGCFPYDAKITLADGREIDAGNVRVGDSLVNPVTGKLSEVIDLREGPEQLPLVEIFFGQQSARLTTKHQVLTTAGLKRAINLEVGDRVVNQNYDLLSITEIRHVEVGDNERVVNFILNNYQAEDIHDHLLVSDGIITGDLILQNELKDHE